MWPLMTDTTLDGMRLRLPKAPGPVVLEPGARLNPCNPEARLGSLEKVPGETESRAPAPGDEVIGVHLLDGMTAEPICSSPFWETPNE